MTRKSKIIVTIALMLGMSLAALDITIVGTAMPTIVGKLGGITLYSWVFSVYLITSWLVPSSLSTKKMVSWHSSRFVYASDQYSLPLNSLAFTAPLMFAILSIPM